MRKTTPATTNTKSRSSIQSWIVRLRKLDEIDSDGIENSLLAKVDAALAAQGRGQSKVVHNHLAALIHELEAQSGKHITVRAANLLIGDAHYIQTHLP